MHEQHLLPGHLHGTVLLQAARVRHLLYLTLALALARTLALALALTPTPTLTHIRGRWKFSAETCTTLLIEVTLALILASSTLFLPLFTTPTDFLLLLIEVPALPRLAVLLTPYSLLLCSTTIY